MGSRQAVDAVASRIAAVPGVGNVHRFLRWGDSWDEVFTHFADGATNTYRSWQVTRVSTAPTYADGLPGAAPVFEHTIQAQGILSLHDAAESERTWQDVVDLVIAALTPDDEDAGLPVGRGLVITAPPSLTVFEPRQFGQNILVHYAELELPVRDSFGSCGAGA